jgi:hypothetical protein
MLSYRINLLFECMSDTYFSQHKQHWPPVHSRRGSMEHLTLGMTSGIPSTQIPNDLSFSTAFTLNELDLHLPRRLLKLRLKCLYEVNGSPGVLPLAAERPRARRRAKVIRPQRPRCKKILRAALNDHSDVITLLADNNEMPA